MDEIDAAFWPLLAMVELAALFVAVLVCAVLAMAGLAVQLRRRRAQGAVRSTGDTHAARVAEHEEEPDPLPF